MNIAASIETLDIYKDYTYMMYVVCEKTSALYSTLKNIINIPIIISSSCLSILNSTEFETLEGIDKMTLVRYVTMGFNIFIALSVAILNFYKIAEKEFFFKTQAVNFLKTHNKIIIELAKQKTTLSEVETMNIINEYNLLCEYIPFHIPSYIRKSIHKQFKNYKMPVLLLNPRAETKSNADFNSTPIRSFMRLSSSERLEKIKNKFFYIDDKSSSPILQYKKHNIKLLAKSPITSYKVYKQGYGSSQSNSHQDYQENIENISSNKRKLYNQNQFFDESNESNESKERIERIKSNESKESNESKTSDIFIRVPTSIHLAPIEKLDQKFKEECIA